jgi:magnesium chelatase family protein
VARAREVQAARQGTTNVATNARLDPAALRGAAALDEDARRLLRSALERLRLSGRSHDRLLRVARTLADLDGEPGVRARHVSEALHFRAVPASE